MFFFFFFFELFRLINKNTTLTFRKHHSYYVIHCLVDRRRMNYVMCSPNTSFMILSVTKFSKCYLNFFFIGSKCSLTTFVTWCVVFIWHPNRLATAPHGQDIKDPKKFTLKRIKTSPWLGFSLIDSSLDTKVCQNDILQLTKIWKC